MSKCLMPQTQVAKRIVRDKQFSEIQLQPFLASKFICRRCWSLLYMMWMLWLMEFGQSDVVGVVVVVVVAVVVKEQRSMES